MDISPLRHREFRLVFTASSFSTFGSMITFVAIPFQLKDLTGDPLAVGLLGLCELVPLLFMAFVGGALADYVDRRKLVVYSRIAFAALTAILLANSMIGEPQIWLLYVIAALSAAIDGIHRPAFDAMMPRLAPLEMMPAVSTLNSLKWQVGQIGGPTIAGVLLASHGMTMVYAVDLALAVIALAFLLQVRAIAPPEAADRPSIRSVIDGIKYAKSRPELIGTYLVDINAMLFAFPVALFPFMVDKYGGPEVVGLLYGAIAIGSMSVTLTSRWVSKVHRHGLAVILAAGTWGLGIIVFGVSSSLWLALAGLFVAGAADMLSGVFRSTIWNQTIPDHLRGRLAGIEMLSYLIGPLLGQTRSGLTARWWGYGGSVAWGGVLCVVGTVALAAALPKFLRYDGRDGLAHRREEEEARALVVASASHS